MLSILKKQFATRLVLFLAFILFFIVGCAGDSGAPNDSTLDSNGGSTANNTTVSSLRLYAGPGPSDEDAKNFKRFFWDPITGQGSELDKCSTCHSETGAAPSKFARLDDVNLAYTVATTGLAANGNRLVDLTTPENSEIVQRVAIGHNCWEPNNSICQAQMINYIIAWRDGVAAEANQIALVAPVIQDPQGSKTFPESSASFASTLWPVLNSGSDPVSHCQACHSDTAALQLRQTPYFASDNVDLAYESAKPKMDLISPENSRFVEKLAEEQHNCWSDCVSDAAEILAQIQAFSNPLSIIAIDLNTVVASKALRLNQDGIVASSGGRVEDDVIALYEFREGTGNVVADLSGVGVAADLNLSGDFEWLGAWGIQFDGGKAQATVNSSQKLHEVITQTGEYAIEAWVAPSNVTQEGPARIIAYSGGNEHNFLLGQTLYNYNFAGRSSSTNSEGMPMLSTADADEDLQATLQHVVVNYDSVNGRRIYVNGVFTDDEDSLETGHLQNWNNTYPLVLGSNVDGSDPWRGSIRLLAIHSRVLSDDSIQKNFDAGVGLKFLLLFSVSHLLDNTTDAFIIFEVSQFDNYSYLFSSPYFKSLDPNVVPETFSLQGMRIGINGKIASVGQAFATLNQQIDSVSYTAEEGQSLSSYGTIIQLEEGPDVDQFFLSFDQFANHSGVFVEAEPADPIFTGSGLETSTLAVRNFAEINHSFAQITGVSVTQENVDATYQKVVQQLPSNESMQGFLSSHQMGITQLAISYCDVLIEDQTLRDALGISLDEVDAPTIDDANSKSVAAWDSDFIDPMLAAALNTNLSQQPLLLETKAIVHHLLFTDADGIAEIDAVNNPVPHGLSRCNGGCPDGQTANAAKAACAAVLGSAAITFQ